MFSHDTDIHHPDLSAVGNQAYELAGRLYPICRSITGEGVRATLRTIQETIPLEIHEVPTGTPVFDWTVPREWNIREAYIKDAAGRTMVDFRDCNLHVVSYSRPVKTRLPLDQLKEHVFSLPDRPEWIPYRTSYYHDTWGFCLRHDQLGAFRDGDYDVCIDSSLTDGYLTFGEYRIQGDTDDEILISVHVCHPSLANDNLSGIAVATALASHLTGRSRRYSYRFLFIPGTIGSITWLSLNERQVKRIRHGLVLSCVGDAGHVTYKRSRRGTAEIDRAVIKVLKDSGCPHALVDFSPYGYDERQYCSPGFDLPVGCFMRTPNGKFPEYHTSADNLDLLRPGALADSWFRCLQVFDLLEDNRTYVNLNPKCEPQLGRRGLYSTIGGQSDGKLRELAMLWVLNLSDGRHSLLDIAERAALPFALIRNAAHDLFDHRLLMEADSPRDEAADA